MSSENKKAAGDLTSGPIGKSLLLFAIPLFGSSLVQQLYSTVDIMFVGWLLPKEAMAAVGASSLLVTCMLGFFTGIGVGVGVLAANSYGAKDYKRLHDVIHTAAAFTISASIIFMILGWILSPVFLGWMNTPDDIMELALVYIRYYFLSLFSVVSYNISSGILRSLGNSRSPLIYQFIGGLTNVFANFMFMYVLKMGVAGAALATLMSQSMAAFLTVSHLFRIKGEYGLKIRDIHLHSYCFKDILTIGIPSGVQSMIITFSNLVVQSQINSLGVVEIAAFTAYFKVENFVYLPIMAFGQAVSTFVSQNIGARKLDRAKQGTKMTIMLGCGITIAISVILLVFSSTFFGMFSSDPDVVRVGITLANMTFPVYFLYVFLEVFGSSIRGAGKAVPVMLIIVFNMVVVRVSALMVMMHVNPKPHMIALIYPITWLSCAGMLGSYYLRGSWIPAESSYKSS